MAGPGLATNIDTTYADSGADASVKLHQQYHDVIHAIVNEFDTGLGSATVGQATVFNGTEYAPGVLGVAGMAVGSRLTLIWDSAQARWEDTAGAAVSSRPGGRNDILLDLIGGSAANAPAFANQPGDIHYPTS